MASRLCAAVHTTQRDASVVSSTTHNANISTYETMPRVNDPYERQHIANLVQYGRLIDAIYRQATIEAAAIADIIPDFDTSRLFSFSDYPITQQRIQSLLSRLENSVETAIVNGINAEWTLANNKNNELSRRVFGDNICRLTQAQYRRYFSTNDNAREAFLQRKEQGLNLSERVWRYTNEFKDEIELGLDVGIRNGLDAPDMARQLQQFLQHPDMLFRRVRDEHGNLVLSKRAADFHPGQGVYRSSYKNARRLAVTETNMAYRSADYERYQQLDFVVGIEIKLSNNHNCVGVPPGTYYDICDELQGRYPKDFKFPGWHPHCRCHVISILKTEAELMEENAAILRGEEPTTESVNRVDNVPEAFTNWLADNQDRAKRSFSMPYFIADNPMYIPNEYRNAYSSHLPYDTYAQYVAALRYNKAHADFTPEIVANNRELSQELPVVQGKIMNITEANEGKCNPLYGSDGYRELGYADNCQTCTMTYELRRRGFDVEAAPNPVVEGYKRMRDFEQFAASNGVTWQQRFINADGTPVVYSWSNRGSGIQNTIAAKKTFIEEHTQLAGRYEIYCAWKGGGAHVFIAERTSTGELLLYDPQSGKKGGIVDFRDSHIKPMKHTSIGVLRIDDKLINPKFAQRFLKATT